MSTTLDGQFCPEAERKLQVWKTKCYSYRDSHWGSITIRKPNRRVKRKLLQALANDNFVEDSILILKELGPLGAITYTDFSSCLCNRWTKDRIYSAELYVIGCGAEKGLSTYQYAHVVLRNPPTDFHCVLQKVLKIPVITGDLQEHINAQGYSYSSNLAHTKIHFDAEHELSVDTTGRLYKTNYFFKKFVMAFLDNYDNIDVTHFLLPILINTGFHFSRKCGYRSDIRLTVPRRWTLYGERMSSRYERCCNFLEILEPLLESTDLLANQTNNSV